MDREYPAIVSLIAFWVIVVWVYLIFGWQILAAIVIVAVAVLIGFAFIDLMVYLRNRFF